MREKRFPREFFGRFLGKERDGNNSEHLRGDSLVISRENSNGDEYVSLEKKKCGSSARRVRFSLISSFVETTEGNYIEVFLVDVTRVSEDLLEWFLDASNEREIVVTGNLIGSSDENINRTIGENSDDRRLCSQQILTSRSNTSECLHFGTMVLDC